MIRALPATSALLALTACGTTRSLSGTVVDIWGDPVEGAVVKLDGSPARATTNRNGRFSLPWTTGDLALHAGREGYIQADLSIEVADGPSSPELVFELFPIPAENGFHVVGSDGYVKLEARPIYAVGNNLRSLYGLKDAAGPSVDAAPLRFVYHGPLTRTQLAALDVSLHRLGFVETAQMIGVTAMQVPLNLHVSDGEVPLDLERLKSRNDYLLTAPEDLERGATYALTTNDLLAPPDDEHFRRVAPAMRLAFPVELR